MIIKLASHHSKKKKRKEETISLQEFRDYNQHKDRVRTGAALGSVAGSLLFDDSSRGLGSLVGHLGGSMYAHHSGDSTRRQHYEKLTKHSE